MTVISYPIPPYSNIPINADYYLPNVFNISAITLGNPTIITTSANHNYVIGQLIRLIIPSSYGSTQLNGLTGYVVAIPAANQISVTIDSTQANQFIATPFSAVITGASNTNPCVVTANNSFKPGYLLTISDVLGMTQLNASNFLVTNVTSATFTLNIDATTYGTYISGGLATVQTNIIQVPQIIAVGDINSGVVNANGRSQNGTYIPGAFINISPT